MKTPTVMYRLPGERQCVALTQTKGEPKRLFSCEELNGQCGFVFAPFVPSHDDPIFLFSPDHVGTFCQDACPVTDVSWQLSPMSCHEREDYAVDFANFHAQLLSGEYDKIVLARCSRMHCGEVDARQLFIRACQRYPRLFVSLVCLSDTDAWLMATPEVLLSGSVSQWHTMALAGTMAYSDELLSRSVEQVWSPKNLMEQEYVSSYITERIEQFSADFNANGPYTMRAAGLMHLRTDFDFLLPDTSSLGRALSVLHPTPAVCGMPKEAAQRFIVGSEAFPRHYYSGFLGPIAPQGDTHLFVSLRCMHLQSDGRVDFYAGGGLLRDSVEEDEWRETEAKMQTMKTLFNH